MINFWYPENWLPVVDLVAHKSEQDRSKFIRTAIREALIRRGIELPEIATTKESH